MNFFRFVAAFVFFLLHSPAVMGGDKVPKESAPEEPPVSIAAYAHASDRPKHAERIVELLSKSGIRAARLDREEQTGTINVAQSDAAAARKIIGAAIDAEKLEVQLVSKTPISISIAIPEMNRVRVIDYWNQKSHFNVVLTNPTDTAVHIWSEGCSWGYHCLTFEVTDKNGKTRTVRKKPTFWCVNRPRFEVLGAGESAVLDVYFSDEEIWTGFPKPDDDYEEVTMRAIFHNHPDDDTKEHKVWTGRIATKPMKYIFSRWRQR